MMDKKNANGFSSKAPERGSQRKQLPYSVETPYGFHLDLDFLKYVDDIEKGNTIKKVHIQRRNKGPKFSTLPRNFSLPGHAARAAPKDSWASTSTLGPKPRSRVTEVQQIFEFRPCEGGSPGQLKAPGVIHKSTREDGSIREFDEQPLGFHVRPHLLRASSMPVTVLQGKSSESVEDRGAQAAGDSCRENGSSGNVCISSDVVDRRCGTPQDQTALHQQFATALQRIRELEEQVRTIPELRAQICTLREEKEHLLLKLNSQPLLLTVDGVQNAGNVGTDDQTQIPVNSEESVVTDTAPGSDQQVVPSPVQEPGQESVTVRQESEVQEDAERPLESQSVKQEVVSESPSTQEPTEHGPADGSTTQELVMQEEIPSTLQEPAEEEPAQSPSTQELVKDGIAESSSLQEPNEQDLAESLITEESVKVRIAEHSSVQEPAEQEITESSTTLELVIQDKISESSLQEPSEDEPAQSSTEEELAMEDVSVERCKTPEPAEQELADSPSMLESVKLDEEVESNSAMESEKQETTESSTAQVSEGKEEAEPPTAQEPVQQIELSEDSLAQEPVQQNELSEDSSAQEPVQQNELSEDSLAQEPVQQNELSEDSLAQEPLQQNELSEDSSAQEPVEQIELSEDSLAQEPVQQNELSEDSSAQEPVQQNELSEDSSAQEPAEKETIEIPTAQETLNQEEVSESSTAQDFVAQETSEPHTAQDPAQEEGTESHEVQEVVEQGEVEDNSSMPEAAGQETTTDTLAQKPIVQDEVLESSSAPETVLQEQTEQTPIVEEATKELAIMEGHSGQEKVVTEGDQLSSASDNLTIKELQEKLMALEEKFSDANKELEKTNALLSEQIEENKLNEERIKMLTEETKAEKAQVEQEIGDLGDTMLSSDPALTCDAAVCTDSAPKLVSKEVSTDRETLFSDTLAIAGEPQKNLISTSTQTDFTEAQVSAGPFTVEKLEEAELTVHAQVLESASQEEPCSAIQTEPEKAAEAESFEEPVGPESSEHAASDSAEEPCTSLKISQPCQSSQEQGASPQGPSEPTASNAVIGQYVNRIQGLLNEQWACLGSGQPEIATTIKQPASKFSSIQTQLVSSLNALSAFYSSPGQKGGANRQAALKSIMKKNDSADKPGNGGAKKNLKFVGVNGGYETTSSEDSSEEDNAEDSSEPEEKEEDVGGATEVLTAEEPACEGACAAEPDCDAAASETSGGLLEEQPGGVTVDEGFMAACHFIKDRQAEIAAPDKEMREALTTLYQEWFRVSSQKDSLVDTVTLHLKEVGAATPTLLRFLVNLADGNGNTALHYSVSHSNFSIVKLLLDTGLCEADIQNKAGYTAIMLASLTTAEGPEDMEVAQQLLGQGNVNARASQAGQTALMLAVSHGRVAMVRLLLACGAEVNAQDHDGSTALMCACEHGHAEIARLLLERPDCDLGLTDREGHSALEVATQASHSELVDLLKARASEGASDTPSPL